MKKTILLADSDNSVRENLARVLELDQYRVVTASSGTQAAEKLSSERPNLALFDLDLSDENEWPGLDSLCDSTPSVPIVLITARSHQFKRALQLGADAFMEKPLCLPFLLRAIRNLVREPAGERLRRLIDPEFKTVFLTEGGLSVFTAGIAEFEASEHPEKISF